MLMSFGKEITEKSMSNTEELRFNQMGCSQLVSIDSVDSIYSKRTYKEDTICFIKLQNKTKILLRLRNFDFPL